MGCLIRRKRSVVRWIGLGGVMVISTLISTVPTLGMLRLDDAGVG